ncbi:hypothetical protein DL764_010884 [Monosporascus ibericus]|uniref:Uncharacterized protein n=1 Tax=Monosporascus ibericus TaxID=155417 RepID=A0A4Q4SRZ5_9PEZI|nr:hypothetical protein DL764_010884 [Monosporascus ibericus]
MGPSLNHSGMEMVPATVPKGSLFYHGTHRDLTAGPPPGSEWLAIVIEESEGFAFFSFRWKWDMGILDTQDLVQRSVRSPSGKPLWDEYDRAKELCRLVTDWRYDGIVRMEIGFEVIHCNFTAGLDLLSMLRRPFFDQPEGCTDQACDMFQFARAIAYRYDGLNSSRVKLDFSTWSPRTFIWWT